MAEQHSQNSQNIFIFSSCEPRFAFSAEYGCVARSLFSMPHLALKRRRLVLSSVFFFLQWSLSFQSSLAWRKWKKVQMALTGQRNVRWWRFFAQVRWTFSAFFVLREIFREFSRFKSNFSLLPWPGARLPSNHTKTSSSSSFCNRWHRKSHRKSPKTRKILNCTIVSSHSHMPHGKKKMVRNFGWWMDGELYGNWEWALWKFLRKFFWK